MSSENDSESNVVPISTHVRDLRDIPGLLRQMAANIEAGEYGDVPTLLIVMPRMGDWPQIFGWGDVEGESAPIIQFEYAKHFLVANKTSRQT